MVSALVVYGRSETSLRPPSYLASLFPVRVQDQSLEASSTGFFWSCSCGFMVLIARCHRSQSPTMIKLFALGSLKRRLAIMLKARVVCRSSWYCRWLQTVVRTSQYRGILLVALGSVSSTNAFCRSPSSSDSRAAAFSFPTFAYRSWCGDSVFLCHRLVGRF